MTTPPFQPPDAASRSPSRCISLGNLWEELRRVRAAIEEYLAETTDDFRSAATMTALELCENVLKHGISTDSGMVTMARDGRDLVISTQNRVASEARAQEVVERIARINGGRVRELFIAGMLEAVNQPARDGAGLGLIRIAYEGEFELSCEVMGDLLRIHARRPIEDALSN